MLFITFRGKAYPSKIGKAYLYKVSRWATGIGWNIPATCNLMGSKSGAEHAVVAIDGSKFKAVNNRDKNFTEGKMKRRLEQIDQSIALSFAMASRLINSKAP